MSDNISVKKIVNEGFNLYVNNLIKIIIPMAIFAIPYYLYIADLDIVTKTYGPSAIASYINLDYIIITLATAYINCVVIKITSDHYLKREMEYSSYFKVSPMMVFGLFIQSIIIAVATGVGIILLVFPGILAMLGWYIAAAVYVNEDDENIISSLTRSWELTLKNKGQIFLTSLIVGLLMILLTFIGYIIFNQGIITIAAFTDGSYNEFTDNPVYNILYNILVTPISTVLIVVIYFNLRELKEGFQVEQLTNNFMEHENESETHNW